MKGDKAVESGADKLDELAVKAAERGGIAAKVSSELAEDASFLRKLKPSLMMKRAKGELPKDQEPGSAPPPAPGRAQLPPRPKPGAQKGPNPFVVIGVALAAGIAVAKWIDWRGHAHPRR